MEFELTAYCGVDCSACADYANKKCPGCRRTEWKEDICLPFECCRKKQIDFCGDCTCFSCPEMREFYHESKSHEEAYERMLLKNKQEDKYADACNELKRKETG